MKMNAVKHGCDAAPENDAAVMRALGEDPEHYAALKRDLATAYGPGDAFWDRQTEDLARLYWRRNRLERMETGLMRDALEEVEERRRRLARDLADVTFEPSQGEAVAPHLPQPTDPLVRLRLLISLWGVIREQVGRRYFSQPHHQQIESYYQDELGWRPRQIVHLLGRLYEWARLFRTEDQASLDQYVKDTFGDEAGRKGRCQELERLVEEQITAVKAAFAEEMKAQERKDAIARDACLAPEGKTWEMLLRLEMALDRSIDRKVRILLTMRKEHARMLKGAGADTPVSVCDSGQDTEARPSLRETQTPKGRGLRQPAQDSATECLAEENALKTPNSPEQSQNVIENKGSAADGVAA
jgi:hypothetical protein